MRMDLEDAERQKDKHHVTWSMQGSYKRITELESTGDALWMELVV